MNTTSHLFHASPPSSPPPILLIMLSKRMTANPARPSRYRAGKPTGAYSSSESDSEVTNTDPAEPQQTKRKIPPQPKERGVGKSTSNLNNIERSKTRDETQETGFRQFEAAKAARPATDEGFITEDSHDNEEDTSDDIREDEAESSDEEAPRPLMLKPRFVPKTERQGHANGIGTFINDPGTSSLILEETRRRKAIDEIVEEQMRRDVAARAVGKRHWDDAMDEEDDVDTGDDIDPEAEFAAWKLRELKRIKREREAIEAREKDKAEVERRRNLTEEERKAEDEIFLTKQKEEKDAKGKMSYMQKYFHGGAFYRYEAEAEGLAKRDIMGSRFADDVKNRELLPKALQMRDMTKLGKKGATKYKDLKSEDTGRWGEIRDPRLARSLDFYMPNDKFKTDREASLGGANAVPIGDRKPIQRQGDGFRESHPRGSRREDRSRSTSARRNDKQDYNSRRKRDWPPETDQPDEKRRRRVEHR
ncbi:splicing factor, Prp19-binding domain-containing protein [Durotheca rogersii]|uniref:splicing factor, Prp19-binding domain-containing protein n=1 Tax=Durotheca rogersii TaxID=419775 RepID=UPI002220F341|nr:splicing factor, Prp19-binding domain-containing protein [Durotheca rogersii]KAI5862738.1 splicing factor, Prp19-binding domain-containing protein [Durotheca rogersii]